MATMQDVFYDRSGKRWGRFWLVFALLLGLALIVSLAFIDTLLVTPKLKPLQEASDLQHKLHALIARETNPPETHHPPQWLRNTSSSAAQTSQTPLSTQTVRAAFYVNWDPNSLVSLKEHLAELTHIIPEWFSLVDVPPRLVSHAQDPQLSGLLKEGHLSILPLLTNLQGSEWQPEAVESLLRRDSEAWGAFAEALVAQLKEAGCGGVLIDWQLVDPVYQPELSRFIAFLSAALHNEELELWLAIPVGNDTALYDLDALAPQVDRFLATLYDENGENDEPGPPASLPWFAEWLEVLMSHGHPGQWVIGLGNYGYDWPQTGDAETIGFADAMTRVRVLDNPDLATAPPLYTPSFSYSFGDEEHRVWFLDGISFRNQARLALARGAGGLALFRLGTEDPAIWHAFDPKAPASLFEVLPSSERIAHLGRGDFLTIKDDKIQGFRKLREEADGTWSADYQVFPGYPTIYHDGASEHEVALTFDDGPDPRWTPAILDILKAKGAKASFFVVGVEVARYPEIVRRILDEGHEIGLHTYFHPDLSKISAKRLLLELNASQRLLEGVTGRSTTLFRPPYNVDSRPGQRQEVEPLIRVQELGYTTVTQSLDTLDWERPGVEAILAKVEEGRPFGNTLLMHDAGGDRSQTLKALPRIIDYLRQRGDEIVPLGRLIQATPDDIMPLAGSEETPLITRTGFSTLRVLERLFWAFMILATGLVLLRTLVILVLALIHRRRSRFPQPQSILPPVSVLLAAYNEAKVITATLNSVLATDYGAEIEVVVVDDGSKDETAERVAAIAAADPRVRLVRQANLGKAKALQAALAHSSHEHLVMLDADTQVEPETIGRLVRFLQPEAVAAVSGHIKVGNRDRWLGRFQSLEYTCGFNLDRRAYDVLNAITVVPGAACAIKRSAIEQVGGIPGETLAEDTDLTLAFHRAGYRIRYAPDAVAWTEAPETIPALARQRVRWSFGTFQCLWKYGDMMFNPRYRALGWFSLPSIAIFQMFLVAMIPLVDALLGLSLVWGFGLAIVNYVVIFLLVDLVLAAVACWMEREPLRQAFHILLMRLVYRPLLAYAVWRSLFRALRGSWSGWSKLERRGTVLAGRTPG